VFVPLSVLEFRDRAETYFGEKVGVVDGDKRFTYRQFGERTHGSPTPWWRSGSSRATESPS
jgi:fatty-acyl-CoA synthase